MDWLEQNIDAYRIVSEILGDLRRVIRSQLEAVYGDSWYRDGLPEDLFKRLVAAKERERSIEWYDGEYQQIMDYAVFADLVEILAQNQSHFPSLVALAPNMALLQARFIELDVMRAKLGRARPISETELSFLGTFHLRFRKAAAETVPPSKPEGEAPEAEFEPEPSPAEPVPESEPRASEASSPAARTVPADEPPPSENRRASDDEAPPAAPPSRKAEAPKRTVRVGSGDDHRAPASTPDTPPSAEQFESTAQPSPSSMSVSRDHVDAEPSVSEGESESPVSQKFVGPEKLAEALEGSDNRTVLRELYREVTAIAESVWSADVTPAPLVWEQVTASDWYEANFSRLGLHPLSVFYEVTSKVEAMTRTGATKKEQQEFLKETNFAKTLLALRDMFQANNL